MSNSKKSTKGKASGMNSQKQPQKARIQNKNINNSRQLQKSAPVRSDRAVINNNKVQGFNRTGRRSELVASLSATSTLFEVVQRLRCNPLSENTFTWLTSIAKNYEAYKFHYLAFRYENRCASSTAGSKIMSPSYDAADSDAQAKSEELLYANRGTIDASVWRSDTLVLNNAAMNRLYKSHTCMSDGRFLGTKEDQKTIDAAQVFICLDGCTAGLAVGKLFVDYDVELFEPHSPTEPTYVGGAVADYTITTVPIESSSTLPIKVGASIVAVTRNESEVPILTPYKPSGSVNTSALVQFAKDYTGVLLAKSNVPAYASFSTVNSTQFWVGKDKDTPAGSDGDSLLGYLEDLNRTSYDLKAAFTAIKVIAKANDYLKWVSTGTGSPGTIQDILLQFGGSSVF